MNTDQLVKNEVEKIKSLLLSSGVSEQRVDALAAVIENTSWMKIKLEDTRAKIGDSSVAIRYDNGGGQTGIRENPLYKGYSSLFKGYMSGMDKILAALPPEEAREVELPDKPKTVLEMVRGRHIKEA